jgi:signal transduction histidine kinase
MPPADRKPRGTRHAKSARGLAPGRVLRNLRVRSRLLLLVIIPTVTAIAAGGIFIDSSASSALVYQRVLTLANLSGKITGLVQALQGEREDTVRFIVLGAGNGGRGASPSSAPPPGPELKLLSQDYMVTGSWADQVKALAGGIDGSYPGLTRQDTQAALTAIGNLPAIRASATGTQLPALIVIGQYATVISTLLAIESQIAVGTSDSVLAGSVRVLALVSSMKEEASKQQALLTSALRTDLVSLGQFGPAQQSGITAAQAQEQGDLNEFGTAATPEQRQSFSNVLSSPNIVQAQAQEQQAISLASSGSPIATDPTISDASSALSYVVSGMRSAEQQFADSVISRSETLRNSAITTAAIFSLAVILLLAIALTATIAVGRSMVGPLRRLRNGAHEVAGERLPAAVRRIAEADGDVGPPDVEPIDVDSTDEIGEVARAFDQVHQEAVRLAANEAALRANVRAMFINLSRRSVSLLLRLGKMIDSMEQAEADPERLASLFSMDHLVTRMRRNSENLLVLAGEEPVRKWGEPFPLVDVVRAATSEIEQYSRVALDIQPGVVVSGQAAADFVHLIAEIIENATNFSPSNTSVQIRAHEVQTGGVLIEVRDNGVGIPAPRLAEINERLDNPPLIDVSVSRHMGLFAVGRLAARHGARVRLTTAAPHGVSALVWLPGNLTGREEVRHVGQRSRYLSDDRAAGQQMAAGRRGRHAAPEPHLAGNGQWRDPRQPAAPAGGRSRWFAAKRPAGQGSSGAALSVNALGSAAAMPAASQDAAVAAASGPAPSASGAPAQTAAVHYAAAPSGPEYSASDTPARGMPGFPGQAAPSPAGWGEASWQADAPGHSPALGALTTSGLPLRDPTANRFRQSAGSGAASAVAMTEASSPGRPGMPPSRPVPPPQSPDHARNRLGGFQLGSRQAEAGTPDAGDGASR